jgi:TonB family protein
MILRLIALVLFAASASAQGQEELLARLTSSNETERAEALIALGRVPDPDIDLLIAVSDRLLDPAESVRVTAAYSTAGIASRMGCKLELLADCKLFTRVLDRTPKVVKRVPPKYPDEAKRAREEGRVVLEFVVAADGTASRIRIIDGPPLLREAAAESVRQSKYEAARKGGEPVPFAMLMTISFKLR